ncbi:MAG: ATP-binding protein [Verrucomicrobiota bacterium]
MLNPSQVGFEGLLRLHPWPSAIISSCGEYQYVNGAFSQLIGISELQLLGQYAGESIKLENSSIPFHEFLKNLPYDRAWHDTVQVLDNGKWASTTFAIQRDPDNEHRIYIYSTDAPVVNGRRIMTKNSELHILQILMDNSLDYVFFKDTRGRYVMTNRAFREFLNVPYEGYEIGRGPADFADAETARQSDRDDRETLSSGRPLVNRLIRHYTKDRSRRWLQATKVPVYDSRGVALGIVCIARDVTQEKEREEALVRARQNAERANKAKSQFLANMSHEIRTPLNGIIGMAELCRDHSIDREQSGYVETILMCGSTLLALVNDVLDFSKIEAGLFTLDNSEFNLTTALEDTVGTFHIQARNAGVELITRIQPSVPDLFLGDEKRFKQIIYNIVGNALKFTHQGVICVELVEIESGPQLSRLRMTVHDSGIGIPTSHQADIFDTFTQVDMTTTREFGGTGLGLSICREIVHHMGGQIYVSSEVGEGSTFAVYLDLEKSSRTVGTWSQDLEEFVGLNVLIAEPSDLVSGMVEDTVVHYGFTPRIASSPDHLEAMLRADPPRYGSTGLLIANHDWLADIHQKNPEDRTFLAKIAMLPTISICEEPSYSRKGHLNTHATREISLTKPLRRADLLNSVRIVLKESKTREVKTGIIDHYTGPISPRSFHNVNAAEKNPLRKPSDPMYRILLVEDNGINQQVALKRIERLGFEVKLAENGERALAEFRTNAYDAVMMDVQMPVMDGFEATRRIRELEKDQPTRTPIIAMTARALQGDRERCLESGMDYYLAKPFRAAIFEKMLEDHHLLEIMAENRKVWAQPHPDGDESVYMESKIAETYGRLEAADQEGFRDAADIFTTAASDEKRSLDRLFFAEDYLGIHQKAHALKGVISIFGASPMVDLLQKIEILASEKDLSGLKSAFNEFWTLYQELEEILKLYVITNS